MCSSLSLSPLYPAMNSALFSAYIILSDDVKFIFFIITGKQSFVISTPQICARILAGLQQKTCFSLERVTDDQIYHFTELHYNSYLGVLQTSSCGFMSYNNYSWNLHTHHFSEPRSNQHFLLLKDHFETNVSPPREAGLLVYPITQPLLRIF